MNPLVLAQSDAAAAGALAVFGIIYLAVIVLMIVSAWKIFQKAGEDGWKAIIPIYNAVVMMKIIGRPVWWVALFLVGIIPIIGTIAVIVLSFLIAIDLAKSFGKDTGFGVGMALLAPVFYPILAFGDAQYLGPAGPEPRPGYPNLGGGGAIGAYPQQGFQGGYQQPGEQWGQQPPAPQWGQQPDQQWGQQPQAPQPDQQWGQQPQAPQPDQQWGQQPQAPQPDQQWGQQPQAPQPDQQWGQQPQAPQWGQQPPQGDGGGYPPPPVS